MHRHEACVTWLREDARFTDRKYSRAHVWSFDGGARVAASSSPSNVPVPYSVPEAVDPEEALIAATSSCHMLWFLALAAERGFVVDSYVDQASGVIEKNAAGRQAFSRISLCPQVQFSGESRPTQTELDALHARAHDNCFIANSLACEVVVAAASPSTPG